MEYENELFEIDINSYDDSTKLFLKEMLKYPMMSQEEFEIYHKKYLSGDNEAAKRIVEGFLRLIVWCARGKKRRTTHMELLELIQEGSIGILKAIEKYDVSSETKFTTYATWWINQAIGRSIEEKDNEIRTPSKFNSDKYKYNKLKRKYEINNQEMPSDEEVCKILDISMATLDLIKQDINNLVRLNNKVGDEEDNEFVDFVVSKDEGFSNILNDVVDNELLIVIKEVLRADQYYILYNRVISQNPVSLMVLAERFCVTRERIRQIEAAALDKVKKYIVDVKIRRKMYEKISLKYGKKIDNYNVYPLKYFDVIKYLYIKEKISVISANIYYLKYLDALEYSDLEIMNMLGLNQDDYRKLLKTFEFISSDNFINSDEYIRFKNNIIKTLGGKVLLCKPQNNENIIDYKYISDLLHSYTFKEIKNMYPQVDNLSNNEYKLLERYLSKIESNSIPFDEVCRDVSTVIYGYKRYDKDLSYNILYDTYINNIDSFTEQQRLCLECLVFNKKSRSEYFLKYSKSSRVYRHYCIEKIEKIYFNIDHFLDNNLTKEKYIAVKKDNPGALTDKRVEIMDLIYGVNGEKLGINEIAKLYNEDYIKMHDFIRSTREYIINLYMNRNSSLKIDSKVYIPYILDSNIDFTDETRRLLKYRFLEEMSYDEIALETGLAKNRISNILTDAIRKIDFYRYGIFRKYETNIQEIFDIFDLCFMKDTGNNKNIIYDYFINVEDKKVILDKYNIDEKTLNSLIKTYKEVSIRFRVKDILISKEDVLEAINLHVSESILNDRDKEVLNLIWVENHKIEELSSYYNVKPSVALKYYEMAILKVKRYKANMIDDSLSYIRRNELVEVLKDRHLPISKKERDIICYLYEIHGYPYKTIDEIASIYNESSPSVKRRYQRAILSIKKYLAKEIQGIIDYEEDIVPIMKYFSTLDREYLKDIYLDGLSYESISKKYNITFNQVVVIADRLKMSVYELLNCEDAKKFDFDYYDKVIDCDDLPFYGNKDIAIEAFRMYFGHHYPKRLEASNIVKEMDIDVDSRRIIEVVQDLMLAVCKYQRGMVKEKTFTLNDVVSYYKEYNDEMDIEDKKVYERYFEKCKDSSLIKGEVRIPYKIIYDLMSTRFKLFDPYSYSKDDILKLIKKYNKELNNRSKKFLLKSFGFLERDFMNGREIGHVYRIMSLVLSKTKVVEDEKKLLYLND